MPEFMLHKVARATRLEERYLAHAAHQSMTSYLHDWEAAAEMLAHRIERLRAARDDREANGFPTAPAGSQPEERAT